VKTVSWQHLVVAPVVMKRDGDSRLRGYVSTSPSLRPRPSSELGGAAVFTFRDLLPHAASEATASYDSANDKLVAEEMAGYGLSPPLHRRRDAAAICELH
jgi:hypothetical protein